MRIGHASIDENGKAHGGAAGDQTKKEVCVRSWYDKKWDYILRPKDSKMAEKMATYMEQACANNNIGYDQWQRLTLYNKVKANGYNFKTVGKCETDCSALVCTIAIACGVPAKDLTLSNGNLLTTRYFVNAFKKTGMFDILTDKKYLTSSNYLKRGDILLCSTAHTAIALDNGSKVTTAPAPTTEPVAAPTNPDFNEKTIKVGQEVKLVKGAKYSDGKSIPSWVFGTKLYVRAINGKNITISTQKTGAITGVVNIAWLEGYKAPKAEGYKAKVTGVSSFLNIRKSASADSTSIGRLYNGNEVTILEEKNGWGLLSTGGYVSLKYIKKV